MTDRKMLFQRYTACTQNSSLDFGEWFKDQQRARSEIELLLSRTGKRIADVLRSPIGSQSCVFTAETSADRQPN